MDGDVMNTKDKIRAALAQYDVGLLDKPSFTMGAKKFDILADMLFRITFMELVLARSVGGELDEKKTALFERLLCDRELYTYARIRSEKRGHIEGGMSDEFLSNPAYKTYIERNRQQVSAVINKSVSGGVIDVYKKMHAMLEMYVEQEREEILALALGEKFDELYAQWVTGWQELDAKSEELKELRAKNELLRQELFLLEEKRAAIQEQRVEASVPEPETLPQYEDNVVRVRLPWWRRVFSCRR